MKPEACLGNIPNFFAISGGNLSAGVNSNTDYITVAGTAAFNLDKTVSKDNGTTYAGTATVPAGSNVRFRLKFTPTAASTAAMRHVTFADLLPKDDAANDWHILNRPLSRNSAYSFNFLNTFATAPLATTGYDATNSANVKVNTISVPTVGIMFPYAGGTGTATWTTAAIPANSKNIGYYFGTTPIASPNVAQADFDAQVPVGTTAQLNACNTFAGNAAVCHLINSTLMTNIAMAPSESATACVTTTPSVQTVCCDSVKILQPDATTPQCCSRIQSKNCEIKSVTVNITNGTIGGVTFGASTAPCFNNPSPAIGLTNYTFTPISGVCNNFTAQICPTPTVAGIVIVNYSFTFANGETCRKADTLKCELIQPECCKDTKVISLPAPKCCSQLTTTCPVRQILVTVVSGGQLGNVSFAGTSAGFYTGISNSTLTSANFLITSTGLPTTGLDITVCPKVTANPTIIRYNITFLNGQQCEKFDTIRCNPVTQTDCVINACFSYTATGLLVNINGGTTTSNQPIVMYYWNFGDGTNAVTTTPTTTHTYATNGTYKLCMTVYTNFGGSLCLCTKEVCREIKVAQGTNSAVNCTTGLTHTGNSEIGKIIASPNPSSENFHIKLENATDILSETDAELKVLNLQGTLLFSKKLAIGEAEMDIPAQSFPAGLYFVSLMKEGEVISTIKVVKN